MTPLSNLSASRQSNSNQLPFNHEIPRPAPRPRHRTAASAQDAWTVWTGLKTINRFTEENTERNTVSVFPARLKQGYMRVNYHQKEKNPGWVRTLAVFDSTGNELYKKQGAELRLTTAQLKKWMALKKVEVYTWSLPTDPKLAATVRVRRVHLVTLQLK
jgi:hypothetical protein